MALIEMNLYSEVLNLDIPVSIILPQNPEKPLKTFWLYHGSTGDHTLWIRYTNLERYARERGIAVVVVTAHKSMFTNMVHGQNYAEFLGVELVERLREVFPACPRNAKTIMSAGSPTVPTAACGSAWDTRRPSARSGRSRAETLPINTLRMTAPTADAAMSWSLVRVTRPNPSTASNSWHAVWWKKVDHSRASIMLPEHSSQAAKATG